MKISISLKNLLLLNTLANVSVAYVSCSGLLSVPYQAAFIAGMAIAVFLGVTRSYRPSRVVLNIAAVGIAASAVMRITFNTVVETFTEAVMMMIVIKMLEDRRARDYLQIISMTALAVICSAIVAASEMMILQFFIISFLSGFELLLAAWFDRAPDAVLSSASAARFLGRSFSMWLTMLPFCLAVFFLTPRAAAVVMQMPGRGDQNSSLVGFSDTVALGSVGAIKMSDAVAFRAEMEPVEPQDLYWRGITLEVFTGNAWLPSRRGGGLVPSGDAGSPVTQSIVMEPSPNRWLFAIDIPVAVYGDGVMEAGEGVFRRVAGRGSASISRRFEYRAISIPSPTIEPSAEGIDAARLMGVPDNFSPSLRELAESLTSGADDADKPGIMMDYLSPPRFGYTLEDLPTSRRALEEFVLTGRMGNCEYFASAMAVMLRMSGVPSRLVAGYHGGVYNDGGGYYIVSQNNAHVWVEAWDDESNLWRRYDPTPAEGGGGASASGQQEYSRFSLYMDVLNYRISRMFTEYDSESQSEALYRIREILNNPGVTVAGLVKKLTDSPEQHKKIAGASLALVAAVCLLLSVKIFKNRRTTEENLLRGFQRAMMRHGYERRPSDGLEEFIYSIRRGPERDERLFRLALDFVTRFERRYFTDVSITGDEALYLMDVVNRISKL
ncbi:MAG: DUF3488 and transglutaminase-like domain-containing protein [Synergistaceae bacterium]|jgi:hypothetical protein|nr:DUF3488 and transglutaminase-like domain-containing protein [Synergistaceae bacterium]